MKLDDKDIQILNLLQTNAELTTVAIAEKIHMSQSPCWRRIRKFKENGIVKNTVCLLDREKVGMECVVFIDVNLIRTTIKKIEEFEHQVAEMPEVIECYTMTGGIDFMLKVVTKNIRHYEAFARTKLAPLANISQINSRVALTNVKNTTALPLDSQL
jgi:Lrp/AsnC family transcriptional regulator|tara:strand:- start:31 stop:501 length:471 start_codon:yes stop_codon:yes gene_type:complete